MSDEKTYRTRDWQEGAFLVASGLKLARVESGTPRYFIFEERDRAAGLVEGFWRGDTMVNARAFIDAQRRIKDLIHRESRT